MAKADAPPPPTGLPLGAVRRADPAGPEAEFTGERVTLTPQQAQARQRRGQWIALGLFAFVILIFVITMTRLGANAMAGA